MHVHSELISNELACMFCCDIHRIRSTKFFTVKLHIFSYPSNLTYLLGAQKNHLIETNQYFVRILSLITDNNLSSISRREENDRRNYFKINFHESMGLDWDQTRNPCSQTWICSQTRYQLRKVVKDPVLTSLIIGCVKSSKSTI